MKTISLAIAVPLFSALAAGCSKDPNQVRDLEIPQLDVRLRVASTLLDVDYIRGQDHDGATPPAPGDTGAPAPAPVPAPAAAPAPGMPAAPGPGELSRVDITVRGFGRCKLSLYPHGESIDFSTRTASAEQTLEGTARHFKTWHRKEQRGKGWALDYEIGENGRTVRTVSHRIDLGGRVVTCESGRLLASRESARCAAAIDAACDTVSAL